MPERPNGVPSPRRVAAGRRNRRKRKGLTEAGRARLRKAAVANQPWQHSTGPRTAAGRARSALNGRIPKGGDISDKEIRLELTGMDAVIERLAEIRRQVEEIGRRY